MGELESQPVRAARWTPATVAVLVASAALCCATACTKQATGDAGPTPPTASPTAPSTAPTKLAADPRWDRWDGVTAATTKWQSTVATDVLVLALAPGRDVDSVDDALKPVASALRAMSGVELVFSRARPGEARVLVRFGAGALKGPAARDAVLAAWQAAPPEGFVSPRVAAIARGARAIAALEMFGVGGRPEATAYTDARTDALLQNTRLATRSHVAGAVRPVLSLRMAPTALASHGIAQQDVVEAAQSWLAKTVLAHPQPPNENARAALQEIKLARHWTSDGQTLPPAGLDRLAELSFEQGEPIREALNGHLPITFWIVDGPSGAEPADFEAGLRKVAAESKQVFRPTVQSLGASYRFVLFAPEGKEPEPPASLSKRFWDIRQTTEAIVAINAISGLDGIPESVDLDGRNGRAWTVWVSITSADAGAAVLAVRESLRAGGWDVHVLSSQTDTGVSWLLGAWGAGGGIVSAPNASVLAPIIGQVAQRAASARDKTLMRQGPQPNLAPAAWRRVDPKQLLATKLPPLDAQLFADMLLGPVPIGWWHETPVWCGFPVGDLAGTIGQTPLHWQGLGGSGPNHAWLASDVLRIADTTPVVDRVRVNGMPALWAVPDDLAEAPDIVASSFWQMAEIVVELRSGMRVDSLELRQRPLVAEGVEERPAP